VTAVPDIGGSLRGLALLVELVQVSSPMDGDEQVLVSEVVRDIYPGVPIFMGRVVQGIRRYAGTAQIRITVTEGDATVLGDVLAALRFQRRGSALVASG